MEYVLFEVAFVLKNVTNERSEEEDVRSCAQRRPYIRAGRCPSKPRIHMNDFAAALARLHHPLEADRMLLGHRRTDDQNCIRIGKRLLRCGCSASSYRGAQTGHRRAVSNSGLVADANHAQTSCEQFLDQIVLFVVQRGAAQMRDRLGLHQAVPVFLLLEARFA